MARRQVANLFEWLRAVQLVMRLVPMMVFVLLQKPQPTLHFWDKHRLILAMYDIATGEQLCALLAKPS